MLTLHRRPSVWFVATLCIALPGCDKQSATPSATKQSSREKPAMKKDSSAEPTLEPKPTASSDSNANSDADSEARGGASPLAGFHQYRRDLDDGSQQLYTVWIPESYNPQEPAPLIVSLHYGGRVTPYYGQAMVQSLVAPALKKLNAIIVAPDTLGGPWTTEQNEAAVLGLIEHVCADYTIDDQRILLTGFSMGGAGAWQIGGRNQDRFCGVLPMSARVTDIDEWSIPIYVIHSKADTIVPFEPARKYSEQLKEKGADITFVAMDDIQHFETFRFVAPLKQAVPWVERVFAAAKK